MPRRNYTRDRPRPTPPSQTPLDHLKATLNQAKWRHVNHPAPKKEGTP